MSIRAVPSVMLLALVLLGHIINEWIGSLIITPPTIVLTVAVLTVACTPLNSKDAAKALIDGSRFILTTLFSVGIFVSFMNLIGLLGTFKLIAEAAAMAPNQMLLPAAMLMAFLISIPAGALAAGVLALILPTLSLTGLPPNSLGFISIATGLGCMISPAQINVLALAEGFQMSVMQVINLNLKYVSGALLVLLIMAVFLF